MSIELLQKVQDCTGRIREVLGFLNQVKDENRDLGIFFDFGMNSSCEEWSEFLSLLNKLFQVSKNILPSLDSIQFSKPIIENFYDLDVELKEQFSSLSQYFNKMNEFLTEGEMDPNAVKSSLASGQVALKNIEKLLKHEKVELKAKDFNLDSSTLHTSIKSDQNRTPDPGSKSESFVKSKDSIENLALSPRMNLKDLELSIKSCFMNETQAIILKYQELSNKVTGLLSTLSKFKSCTWFKSVQQVNSRIKSFEINSNLNSSETNLVLLLSEILSNSRPIKINPKVTVIVEEAPQLLPDESLILKISELNSEILKHEIDKIMFRSLEAELKSCKEKLELMEKMNKDNNSPDSEDSLNLGLENIKETIEIQELRSALHSMSERYEQEKEILIRDIIESRQDMETQLFRIQNEKNYLEAKLKDTEKIVQDAQRDKERLDLQVASLKKDLERMRESITIYSESRSNGGKRKSSCMFNPSMDYELSESMDKFNSNSSGLYEMIQEEITDILNKIEEYRLVVINNESGIMIIHKLIESFKTLKEIIDKEYEGSALNETDLKLILILNNHKAQLSQKSFEVETLSKKLQDLESRTRSAKTEPSPRRQSPSTDTLKTQMQLNKSKLISKKHEIHLHREQISALKKNIRDLQSELEKVTRLNLKHIKELWIGLAKEIPILSSGVEDMIEVFMKALGFISQDIKLLQSERKGRKTKNRFGIF